MTFPSSQGRSLPHNASFISSKMLKGGRLSTHQNKCIKLCIKKTWWNTQICLVEWQKCNKYFLLNIDNIYVHLTLNCICCINCRFAVDIGSSPTHIKVTKWSKFEGRTLSYPRKLDAFLRLKGTFVTTGVLFYFSRRESLLFYFPKL